MQIYHSKRKQRNQRGQAISEYAMILAFVSILVALVFAWAPPNLGPAINQCFTSMAVQLDNMVNVAENPPNQ